MEFPPDITEKYNLTANKPAEINDYQETVHWCVTYLTARKEPG
jgi:hypothetical protein